MVYQLGRLPLANRGCGRSLAGVLKRPDFSLLEVSKSNKKSRFCSVIWEADSRYDRYSACDAAWVLRRFLEWKEAGAR